MSPDSFFFIIMSRVVLQAAKVQNAVCDFLPKTTGDVRED